MYLKVHIERSIGTLRNDAVHMHTLMVVNALWRMRHVPNFTLIKLQCRVGDSIQFQ